MKGTQRKAMAAPFYVLRFPLYVSKHMALLSDAEIAAFLDGHGEWSRSGEEIARTFEFPDFVESIGFVADVAVFAEKANHHPDIDIRWNKVTLVLSTHSEGGLTAKDVELAARFDTLYAP